MKHHTIISINSNINKLSGVDSEHYENQQTKQAMKKSNVIGLILAGLLIGCQTIEAQAYKFQGIKSLIKHFSPEKVTGNKTSEAPISRIEQNAIWRHGTELLYYWNGSEWMKFGKNQISYGGNGRVVEEIREIEGTVKRVVYTYDSKLTDFCTSEKQYLWNDSEWVFDYEYATVITRNSAGNVTKVEIIEPDSEKYWYTIGYGTDGKANTITCFYEGIPIETLSDIVWTATDGQIVKPYFEGGFDRGNNKIKSCTYTSFEKPQMTLSIVMNYTDNLGSYIRKVTDVENTWESTYTVFDNYGSYKLVSGWFDYDPNDNLKWYEYEEEIKYDAYGLELVNLYLEKDGSEILAQHDYIGDVSYDSQFGYPLEQIISVRDNASNIYHNDRRTIFSDYKKVSSGIEDVTVDNEHNAPIEYYNLQGIRVLEPNKGQLIIRRQGSKSTKEMY